jgi:hypothetical protein
MRPTLIAVSILLVSASLTSCKKDPEAALPGPRIIFKFKFDSDQPRLNNIGQEAELTEGHAAVSPNFNSISAHYLELSQDQWTGVGDGEVIYVGEETNAGGDLAINFDQSNLVDEGDIFYTIPIDQVNPGTYEWLRVSLSYQNFDVEYLSSFGQFVGTVASFVGYNTYISAYQISEETVAVNDDKLQGYWGFETLGIVSTGQAPEGATTVPNPLFDTSPIPQGSCLVTGGFDTPLTITGNEQENIVVTMSLSTNQSFEWIEVNEDGLWEPEAGESVVDMGIRGLIPIVE